VRFYVLGKKEMENEKSIATVGYGNDIAFHAVAEGYEELLKKIMEKATWHFPGLLETKNASIKISKAYLRETSIPEPIFNRTLTRLPGRIVRGIKIPSEIAAPLEFELAPIIGYHLEGSEVDNLDAIKRRNLLCKEEVCCLEKIEPAKTVFLEIDGQPFWKLVSKDREVPVKYVQARINPELMIKNVVST